MDKWKEFLLEQTGLPEETVEIGFESECLLYYDKRARKQKYILNSIREVAGVRIVTVTSPTTNQGEKQIVGITIKFTPFRQKTAVSYLAFLKQNILTISGVTSVVFVHTNKVML
jgi:hypothetical protein